jgi:hypothetical protein
MTTELNHIIAQQHIAHLRRFAERERIARLATGNPTPQRRRVRIGRRGRRRELLVGSCSP